MQPIVLVENIAFSYDAEKPVLNDVSLSVCEREWVCLLGESGIGKTSLLHVLSGAYPVLSGRIEHTQNVKVATVYQNYALFPHLSVMDNLLIVLRKNERWYQRLAANKEAEQKAMKILAQVKMAQFADVKPHMLSGGQRQRVAIGQALAQQAQLLLLDEPFGALDESVKMQLQELIRELQQEYGFGVLLVTHDVEEALYLGSKIYILRKTESGAQSELYPLSENVVVTPELKQSESFFKQLQSLRAYFYRSEWLSQHQHVVEQAASRGFIDEAVLVEIESKASEVWVITKALKQDLDNPQIAHVVSNNLKRGVQYRYIVPGGTDIEDKMTELRRQTGGENIQVFELDPATSVFYFGEVVIYDPQSERSQGYSYLGGEDKGLMFRLPEEFVKAHVGLVGDKFPFSLEGLR